MRRAQIRSWNSNLFFIRTFHVIVQFENHFVCVKLSLRSSFCRRIVTHSTYLRNALMALNCAAHCESLCIHVIKIIIFTHTISMEKQQRNRKSCQHRRELGNMKNSIPSCAPSSAWIVTILHVGWDPLQANTLFSLAWSDTLEWMLLWWDDDSFLSYNLIKFTQLQIRVQ